MKRLRSQIATSSCNLAAAPTLNLILKGHEKILNPTKRSNRA
jgi:hypothetical protein